MSSIAGDSANLALLQKIEELEKISVNMRAGQGTAQYLDGSYLSAEVVFNQPFPVDSNYVVFTQEHGTNSVLFGNIHIIQNKTPTGFKLLIRSNNTFPSNFECEFDYMAVMIN